MTYQQFQQRFQREQTILSWASALLLMIVVIGVALDHSQELLSIAVRAYEQPTETFSSVIRGMAQR